MKKFGSEIVEAVRSGKLAQPFDSAMVKQACPGWADGTYHTFLGKHAIGNGSTTELFVRVGRGIYRLNSKLRKVHPFETKGRATRPVTVIL